MFNTALYTRIEQCRDFILILPPNSLDRCFDEDDWVRKEIECALKNRKNIIPIMLPGFEWPEKLPESIDEVRYYNGIVSNTEYFEQFLDKLEGFFQSKPFKSTRKGTGGKSLYIISMTVIGLFFLFSPLFLIYVLKMDFNLIYRIIYFLIFVLIMRLLIHCMETRPEVARKCFGTVTEDAMAVIPSVLFSKIAGAFGKDIFIKKEQDEAMGEVYYLKRMAFSSWDNHRINFLTIRFRIRAEWYDPSVFYLHALSRGGEAVQMLTRQGFIIQATPDFVDSKVDYLIKNDFHVFLYYNKRKLDCVKIFQCSEQELKEKYAFICREISNEKY